MLYLQQGDPRWNRNRLGRSWLTVGKFGCTSVCVSMLSDYFGEYKNPAQLAADKNLYTSQGLLIWNQLNKIFKKFEWDGRRIRRYDRKAVLESLNNPNTACILEVNHGQHWVVPFRSLQNTEEILIIDPWTGRVGGAIGDYRGITGSSHFRRK